MPNDRILELMDKLVEAREIYSNLDKQRAEAEKVRKQLELELNQAMEDDGIENFKHDVHGTFYRTSHVWCRITNEEKAFEYLREQGIYDDIMQLKPKSDRLNAYIKENFLKSGDPVPEDTIGIGVTITPKIGRRKGKDEVD